MKKSICVVTGTRAEFGLLYPMIKQILLDDSFILRLAVTGSHLSQKFGETYHEIEDAGIPIDIKIPILEQTNTASGISKAAGLALSLFGDYFERTQPDIVIILGDRYEILSVAAAAMINNIPVAHIHGGETTQGAMDESIRHAITKMSYLHFTSCEEYRRRVIQLGEQPNRVFNVGSLGVENVKTLRLMSREQLTESIHFPLDFPFALVTFHPVTLENCSETQQFEELLAALNHVTSLHIIFTKANADRGGARINGLIDRYVASHNQTSTAFNSMGVLRYLSAMKLCSVVIGNSSSGILEAPSFHVPTINIGDRQKGRVQAKSIINCKPEREDIERAIELALDTDFLQQIRSEASPYGDGHVSGKIMFVIKDFLFHNKIDLKKQFYDIKF